MDRARLKTIIILILALVNLFLLGAIGWRASEERSARERTLLELTERFAGDQITLTARLPERLPPAGQTLVRSAEREDALAEALLGDCTPEDLGGGIYRYSSAAGQGMFRSSGSFEITGTLGSGDAEEFCRELCKAFGYQDFSLALEDSTGEGSALYYHDSLPVVNAAITFRISDGVLTAVRGTLLPQLSAGEETSSMTAVTALTRFLEDCRATGEVVSAVTDIALCYELQSTASSPMTLSPAWRITADTGDFFVNCATGKVTHN